MMSLFYAYIHNIRDDNTLRLIMVFATRGIADQWWRAISSSVHAGFFQRISPQFYTHDDRCSVYEFFTHERFKPMSEKFRGKMFFTWIDDRTGRGLPIIPPQVITDHISGNWFYIRSTTNPSLYWHLQGDQIIVSNEKTTQFQIKGRSLKDGTIMIEEDPITIHIDNRRHVALDRSGALLESGVAYEFKFSDFESGGFLMEEDGVITYGVVRSHSHLWELV
ncbi:hypothetical protein BJ165DRAFT_1529050 [Panaeolus papilionaceus]|nr:hypothetical protein BJ165DRAFT_1529050 [Panaeolus papilionaceus]